MTLPGLLEPAAWLFERPEWLQALWLLPLVVLLYLLRRRARRLLVPHLPLWERVLGGAHRRRPRILRTLLSVLLQLAAVGSIVLLLARPYVLEEVPGRGHTIILLDRSLGTRACATDGRILADEVLERGAALAREAALSGSVSLGLFTEGGLRVLLPATGDARKLRLDALDLGAPAGARDWRRLASLVRPLCGKAGARVVVVTPFQPPPDEAADLRAAGVALVGAGVPGSNAGIRRVRRQEAGISVLVGGGGPPRELRLVHDGSTLAARRLERPGDDAEVLLRLPREAGRELEVVLHPPDAFPDDDAAPLVLPERVRYRLLVVAAEKTPELDAFLEASTLIEHDASGRLKPAEFRAPAPEDDVVVLVDVLRDLPLPPGRYLLLGGSAPGVPVEELPGEGGPAQPLRVRKEDPLVQALDLDDWVVHGMPRTRAGKGLDVVVEGSLGPLIARGAVGGARFVRLAVPPDAKASTLPLMPAFPLFLEAALAELGGPVRSEAALVWPAGGVLSLLPGERPFLVAHGGSILGLDPVSAGTGFRLPEIVGRFDVGGGDPPRPLGIAILDHPGVPGPACRAEDPLAAFPPLERHVSLLTPLLVLLGGVLLLEWLLYQRLLSD